MPFRMPIAALLATVPLFAAAPAESDNLTAVITGGKATLTMCQSWLVFSRCRDYNRVDVPQALAVGQTVVLEFGSNTKTYRFPVKRIDADDGRCTVYSEPAGDPQQMNRMVVEPCRAQPTP